MADTIRPAYISVLEVQVPEHYWPHSLGHVKQLQLHGTKDGGSGQLSWF